MNGDKKPLNPYSPLNHAISGTAAAILSTGALHPLDVVKTRLQVQDGRTAISAVVTNFKKVPNYNGTFDAFKMILKIEGPLGLYQGLLPNLIANSLAWGGYFFFYNNAKSRYKILSNGELGAREHLLCATEAGLITTVATNPIWVIKTRMQLQLRQLSYDPKNTYDYRSTWDAVKRIATEEGFRGFYKGMIPSIFGVSHGALHFVVYEEFKRFLRKQNEKHPISSAQYFYAASASKVIASIGTYPYQVIKSRLQEQRNPQPGQEVKYNGVIDVIRKMYRFEGIRGFYKGLFANILRVTPATALTLVVYEKINKRLTDLE